MNRYEHLKTMIKEAVKQYKEARGDGKPHRPTGCEAAARKAEPSQLTGGADTKQAEPNQSPSPGSARQAEPRQSVQVCSYIRFKGMGQSSKSCN